MVNQCRNCGHFFQSTPNPRRPRLFCSDRCRKAWSRKHQLPEKLKSLPRWVRAVGKRPIQCDGSPASSTDPDTWASYSEVMRSKAGDGYGIMLGDGLACWDFDHVDPADPPAQAVELLPEAIYAEVSTSGHGLHVFAGSVKFSAGDWSKTVKLAAEGKPVLLAFSCGKDSIAAWLAMRDMGIEVIPAYLYYVPGLRFVDEELDYFEQKFQTRIKRYPHPSLYRWLNNAVFQAPERLRFIEAARLPEPSYEQMWDFIRADIGLDKNTWCADGVRAADSIQRRGAFVQYGYWRRNLKKVSPIGDWLKGEVLDCIRGHHIELPCDYAWFGRSFDGIDKRFTKVLKDKAPDDYATLLEWFPLLEVDHVR